MAALDAKKAIRFVPVSKDQILPAGDPELAALAIAPGTYPSLLKSYQTVGLYNFAIASQDLPIDLAYRIVDTVFTNRDAMMEVHPAAAVTIPANFVYNTFLPYHEGASRYYANIAAAGALP